MLRTFFEFPSDNWIIICTTNINNGLNRLFCQVAKSKPSFTKDDPLRRMLYLVSRCIVKHRHVRCQNSDAVLSRLQIYSPTEYQSDLIIIGFLGGWNGIHAIPVRIPFLSPLDLSGQVV